MSWRDHAACTGAPPGMFDPDWPELARSAAAQWCAVCPVVVECGTDADDHRDLGLRGGTWRDRHPGLSGRYRRQPLLGGELPPLPARRAGTKWGWVA